MDVTTNNETVSVYDLANWFLNKESMSDKKLQKLSYYAVAWGWALLNHSIVNDDQFEAWVHGPVSSKLYDRYKQFGWNPIDSTRKPSEISGKLNDLLESVWVTYGDKEC